MAYFAVPPELWRVRQREQTRNAFPKTGPGSIFDGCSYTFLSLPSNIQNRSEGAFFTPPHNFITITPIATLLDVLADVVFYITDNQNRLSSRAACNKRFQLLFSYAQTRYGWIHVVAHSQGSVIAHQTLSELDIKVPTALTTFGSPLGTLYKRYLQWGVSSRPNWLNLYRSGDYIGGAIGIDGLTGKLGAADTQATGRIHDLEASAETFSADLTWEE
jgi:hypothetical protein